MPGDNSIYVSVSVPLQTIVTSSTARCIRVSWCGCVLQNRVPLHLKMGLQNVKKAKRKVAKAKSEDANKSMEKNLMNRDLANRVGEGRIPLIDMDKDQI